ncbi:MAG TPA: DUF4340 domain-containing protein, partial [Bacteroidota bacterium]|nr:DUF4340 domain-containing protein [Bacteroidota bacterium]
MTRNTWILAGVLAALIVVAYLVMQRPGESSAPESSGKMLVSFDSAAADKIEVRTPAGLTALERQGGAWMLTSPVRYRADDAAVGSTLSAGNRIELTGLVSSNPGKQGLFQLDSSGTRVSIFEHGAPKAVFWIGKPSPSYTETYVRRDGSDDVYLATGMFSSTFARRESEWRDKTIFKTEQDGIGVVTLRFGDTTVVLARQDSVWKVGNDVAKNDAVKNFTGALANIQADDFIDTAMAVMPPLIVQIEVGGTQIRFYQAKGADKYTVQTSLSPQLFQIYNWKGAQLVKRKKDFL